MTERTSWLHRLDPRVKLSFALLAIIGLILAHRLEILITILVLTHLILLIGRVSVRQILRLWQGLIPVLVIIMILQPVLVPGTGPTLWQLGPIRITQAGLINGLSYAIRLATSAFALAVPLISTPMHTLVRGLEKLGLPYTISMVIGLALGYFGMIGVAYISISEAQQARGLDLSQRGAIKRARAAIPTLIAVIIASLRLSDSLALGLAARGFGITQSRTAYQDIHMTRFDWLALIGIIAGFVGIFVLSRWPHGMPTQ